MQRYLAIFCSPNAERQLQPSTVEKMLNQMRDGWQIVHRGDRHIIAHTGFGSGAGECYSLYARNGVILGQLFRTTGRAQHARQSGDLSADETRRIIDTACQELIDGWWGKYVAFIAAEAGAGYHVVRDPMSQMPCFHIYAKGTHIFFSHIADCIQILAPNLSVNWRYLIAQLRVVQMHNGECGLSEVEDVAGGERLTVSQDGAGRKVLWSPAKILEEATVDDVDKAATALRETVQSVVEAWASCHRSVIHSLSGGLDSSIVAACLARAPTKPQVTCLTYYLPSTQDDEAIQIAATGQRAKSLLRVMGHADERQLARLASRECGYTLIEQARRVPDVDLAAVFRAPLAVVPTLYVMAIDGDEVELKLAQQCGATAVFSGLAGDTIFFNTMQPLPAIDFAYERGVGQEFFKHVGAASRLSRESTFTVFRKAIRHGVLRQPLPAVVDFLQRPHLLHKDAAEMVNADYIEPPWCRASRHVSPGKRSQILGLAHSLYYHTSYRRAQIAESVVPLVSQPLVELCLQIPSYTLSTDGVPRGLTRRAFADLLPQAISTRIVKGTPAAFYQRLARENLRLIRDTLLDGVLASERIIDRVAVERYLTPNETLFRSISSVALLNYFAVEAWVRQWVALRKEAAA